jgi:transcriptional regulator with XRE-family HTH domain
MLEQIKEKYENTPEFIQVLYENYLGKSQKDLADLMGVTTRTVYRWIREEKIESISKLAAERVEETKKIFSILSDVVSNKTINEWLYAENLYINGKRPLDLLIKKDYQTARDLALNIRYGIYP